MQNQIPSTQIDTVQHNSGNRQFKSPENFSILIMTAVMVAVAYVGLLTSAMAQTDWRKDVGTFRIGIVASNGNSAAVAKVEPFRLAIAEALGLNVEIFAAKNYTALINAQSSARIEYAIYSASAYAAAWQVCECVEPLVLPKSSDGSQSYNSIVISAENGPEDVSQLASAKLTGLSQSSFAGSQFAIFELGTQNIELPEEISYSESGEVAIQKFVEGEYNALIGWSSLTGDPVTGYSQGTLNLIAAKNGGKIIPYRVIWKSSAIPNRPHVVRKSLASEAKTLLRNVLTRMYENDPVAYDSIEPVFGGGFVVARHGQFLPVIEYLNSLLPADVEEKRDSEQPDEQVD
ncbi:MAG: PhnD/SsuA/transferrin family substrate-binding protein [Rhizobiaceae bacterium]|nr:PhnD/SsuA/transferrin family substrate-binding protein [Rhizobiaceae bacterium]